MTHPTHAPALSSIKHRRWRLSAAAGSAVALAAGCGGGSSPSPAPPASISVSGTAATGAALASASVEMKCATGTAIGTTGTDGSFTLVASSGRLPCVLRVSSGGTVLHSAATGSGGSARANLTPATELVVARHALADAATYWSGFDAGAASALTETALATAQADVVTFLQDAGVDFSALGNLLTAALTAASGSTAGDAYDRALDALAGAMATGGTTLPALSRAVVVSASSAAVASLPPALLLQPQASGCSALRSATYRLIEPSTAAGTVDAQVGTLVFDAVSMTGARNGGASAAWTTTATPCRFTETGSGYTADVVVSQAGLLFGFVTRGSSTRLFWGLPVQAHTLAELAGTWNQLGMSASGGTYEPEAGTATLNSAGRFTSGSTCGPTTTWSIDSCTAVPDSVLALITPFAAVTDGSFEVVDDGRVTTRSYAYRAGSRDLMLATIGEDGSFGFFAPDKPVPLPTVGTQARNWNFDVSASLLPFPLSETRNTVTANDTGAGTWTRTQSLASAPTVTYSTTLRADTPRRGYVRRPAAEVTASDGRTVRLNEFTFLRMPGMGWSPVVIPGPKTFEPSIGQPPQ